MARVSYSQYGMYSSCQQQYKLNYIDKLGISNANIHLIFGICNARSGTTFLRCDV